MPVKKVVEAPEEPTAVIQISRVPVETILVPIKGTTPFICSNFSDKSKRQMLAAQQGHKAPKEPRDPQAEYEASFYRMAFEDGSQGFGFPATGFKAATVSGARLYGKAISMTALKQYIFFRGIFTKGDVQQLVQIIGEPRMREDVVRLAGPSRSADLRYRAEFPEWFAVLNVTYAKNMLDRSSVISLIDTGGMTCGIGEWRPSRNGEFGCYQVDDTQEIQVIG